MTDELDRLLALPRLCRTCAKKCGGVRCRECWSISGRVMRMLRECPEGKSEQQIADRLYLETAMRGLEREGTISESPTGWSNGLHPEKVALWAAFNARIEARDRAASALSAKRLGEAA